MSEPQIEAYVDSLAERVPHVDAPLGAVLAAGRVAAARQRRRRATALLVGVAAAVAAVLVGTSVVAQSGTGQVAPGAAEVSHRALPAPAGMKFVGTDGVVMAIPEAWVQRQQGLCPTPPVQASYYLAYRIKFEVSCAPTLRPAESPAPAPAPQLAIIARSAVQGCEADRCFSLDGVTFAVTDPAGSLAPELLDQIGDSLRRLPAGYATVPLWPLEETREDDGSYRDGPVDEAEYADILSAAGLDGLVTIDDAARQATTPDQGEVVRLAPSPESTDPGPTVLVGTDGVAIAVPASWSRRWVNCPPAPDTFVVLDPAIRGPACERGAPTGTGPFSHLEALRPGYPAAAFGAQYVDSTVVVPSGRRVQRRLHCEDDRCHVAWRIVGSQVVFQAVLVGPDAQQQVDDLQAGLQVIADVSDAEIGLATEAIRERFPDGEATLTAATVTGETATGLQGNTGQLCFSGRALQVEVYGDFPHISVSPPPGAHDTDVTSVSLTVDGVSGATCVVSVGTGERAPDPGVTQLDLDSLR